MQIQLAENRYNPLEAYSMEQEHHEEDGGTIFEISAAEAALSSASDPAGRGPDAMAAYLDDVKKLPLLSRDEENALAQAVREAESLKSACAGEWLQLFGRLVSGKKIPSGGQNDCLQPEASLQELLQSLQAAHKQARKPAYRCARN